MNGGRPRRVVVTGVGAVSACGFGVDALWSGLHRPPAFTRLTRFEPHGYPTSLAAEVREPPPSLARRLGRSGSLSFADRFAVAAAREALAGAGLGEDLFAVDASVWFGSSTGGMFESEEVYARRAERPLARASVRRLASQPVSGPGEAVARALRATGPVESISSACSSATLAIGLALEALREGATELAVAGGADSLCRVTYGGFNALRAVDPGPPRPFRPDRAGLGLGEGGAVLLLEPLERALGRGRRPLAELCGFGASSDAHHMTAPDPEGGGPARALAAALDDAQIAPERVDFVNAHGTGTRLNDVAEYRTYERVFGERARQLPVTSTKSVVGHLLGSAGAIEAVTTVLCLVHGSVHPTPGEGEIDPETPVRLVREGWKPERPPSVGASLNLAFGGCNGALVLRRWAD